MLVRRPSGLIVPEPKPEPPAQPIDRGSCPICGGNWFHTFRSLSGQLPYENGNGICVRCSEAASKSTEKPSAMIPPPTQEDMAIDAEREYASGGFLDPSAGEEHLQAWIRRAVFAEAAVVAEREACAVVCDKIDEQFGWDGYAAMAAAAIRARSDQP